MLILLEFVVCEIDVVERLRQSRKGAKKLKNLAFLATLREKTGATTKNIRIRKNVWRVIAEVQLPKGIFRQATMQYIVVQINFLLARQTDGMVFYAR